MAFCGTEHIGATSLVTKNQQLELRNLNIKERALLTHWNKVFQKKIHYFRQMCGTIRKALFNKTRKEAN